MHKDVTSPDADGHGEDAGPTRTAAGMPIPEGLLPRGTTVGRYVILDLLGRGGMGVVYRAADPDLDRRVALKVLRGRGPGAETDTDKTSPRLLREAQALAQLSHPNVVTVYDVGQLGDDVYIAMELVEGLTLTRWLREGRRTQREVLDVMIAAGNGLAAAHRAGIAHRDVKPDNIVVGTDGRVCVLDFGLARAATDTAAEDDGQKGGPVLGTPSYMAPEQYARGEVDERSDQFAFCVVLYQVLHGARPFAGRTLEEVAANIAAGKMVRPVAEIDAPGWLQAVIARGLSTRAEDRFPSMQALLDELTLDRDAARRRGIAAVGLVALVGGALLVGRAVADGPSRSPCARVGDELAGIWDGDTSRRLQEAFAATGRPYATATAQRVVGALDGYARDWVNARQDTCEATLVRGSQSAELMDRRVACLDRRSSKLAALTARFTAAPSEALLEDAIELALALPPIDVCNDRDALVDAILPPDDPATRARASALRRRVDALEARTGEGELANERAELEAALAEIRATGYQPLLAEALFVRAGIELAGGDPRRAEQTLYEAAQAAAAAHDDLLAARIWIQLINVVGDAQARHDDALALRRIAEPVLTRAGAGPLMRAEYLDQVGNVLWAKGLYREAKPYHEQALIVRTALLGGDAPDLATSLLHLGGLAWSVGELDHARDLLERGLAIRERAFGPDHPDVSKLLTNLGSVAGSQGDLVAARAYHQRALQIAEDAMGADHTLVAICANNLADVARAEGQLADARRLLERAAAIFTKALGASHPHVATAIQNLGEVALDADDPALALRHFEAARAAFEAALGADHPFLAYPLTGTGLAQLEAARPELAVAPLERALAIREAHDVQPTELAATQLALARALRATQRTPRRAAALAAAARAAYTSAGEGFAAEVAAIDAWLAE